MTEKKKWQLNRAGLLNFWYYDEEEFYFSDGKLLLRGSNGSGKSVTMQSLLPVLLDGRKSPDRLDPFGSRARKMEDYLLGEKDLVNRDERTGYLFLEYKRQGLEQYLTTGIGLRAKRHSNMDFWGFIIQDNRRIGRELNLYKTEYSGEDGKKVKVPLTRQELENRIGQGGRLVRGQKEYMELVNKHVFGFESIEAYEELIKLLIQLRSPKLSKDFKPTVIYEILNASLPALSDEELRPLSDTIENMDQTKQQLEQLKRDQQSLKKLCRHYDRYNNFVLAEKTEGFVKAGRDLRKLQNLMESHKTNLVEEQLQHEKYSNKMADLNREKETLEEEFKSLKKHAVFNVEEEKIQLERLINSLKEQEVQKKTGLAQKQSRERLLQKNINQEEEKNIAQEEDMNNTLGDLSREAEEAKFAGHQLASEEFEEQYQREFHFALWKNDCQEYCKKVETILKVLKEETQARERYQEADLELGEARKELDRRRYDEKKWYGLFDEEKERLLTGIHQWLKSSRELVLTEEEIQHLIGAFNNLYEDYSFEEARSPMFGAKQRCLNTIEKASIKLKHQIEEKEKEKEKLGAEIKEWKGKKDPEPKRHPDTLGSRAVLEKAGIPYLPFFAAVEFKEEVSPEVRERLESAITSMGFLDALIVPEKYSNKLVKHDRILKPNPHILAYTLGDYLYPAPPEDKKGVTAADIDNILRSIIVGSGEKDFSSPTIDTDGRYRVSLLSGHAPQEKQAIFIGKEARLRYRQQVIASLTEDMVELMKELDSLAIKGNQLKDRREKLEGEYNSFPKDLDAKEAFTNYEELKLQVKTQAGEVERVNKKLKAALEKLQVIRGRLRTLSAGMPLDTKEEVYETALGHMNDYLGYLQELEIAYQRYISSVKLLAQARENLKDVEKDVDDLKGELYVLEDQINIKDKQLKEVFQKLEELGAEEIRQEIVRVEKRLRAIPDERVKGAEKKRDALNAIATIEEEIIKKETDIDLAVKLLGLWEKVFLEEVNLNLVKEEDLLKSHQEEKPLKLAGKLLQKVGYILEGTDREKVSDSLNQSFYQEHGVLVEYRPTQDTFSEFKFSPEDIMEDIEDDNLKIKVEQLTRISRRVQLMLEYSGKRVSPYFVLEEMDKDIELQQLILSEKDRELYEDIIVHSVGRIIRSRIYRAEKWVKQIDDLMAKRDTSSGLTFSLKWKARTAEREEELDTVELVEILRRDSRLLGEKDIDRVTRHFRSQIERAKESMVEKGYGETLHQVIKEMLDYRRWFSFTLYYRKEGEAKKELTNHVFFTFSGGEKAMAMYIPLFSAAYSRYLEAREDAPYIISLDEAFAGVDEKNIRDMFDLVESLGFNYIINSQSLWGDYDTVPALSISELVRPQNAPYVTVIRYYWNGKVRRMLRPQEELPRKTEKSEEERNVV